MSENVHRPEKRVQPLEKILVFANKSNGKIMRILALLLCMCISVSAWPQKTTSREAAFLGIQSETISKKKAQLLGFSNYYGSYVSRVIPGTPAEKAGLMPFDYIFGVDKFNAEKDQSLSDMLSRYRAGDEAVVHFMRRGKAQKAKVAFAPKTSAAVVAGSEKKAFLGVSPGGDEDERNEKPGVEINVTSNSSAAEMGLKDGDRIMAINGYSMVDWSDISIAVGMLAAGDAVDVEFERDGRRKTVKGNVKSYDESRTRTAYTWAPKPEERAFLGISSNSLTEEKAAALGFDNAYGSYVTEIIPGTAAEKAGLRPFDYVYGIDEHRTGPDADLSELLKKYKVGDKAVVHYIRQGKPMTAEATFSNRTAMGAPKIVVKTPCDKPFLGVSESHWREESSGRGVPVDIVGGSTAEAMGMKNGDVILKINDYPVVDWSDISVAISAIKVGEEITVLFRRGSTEIENTMPIKSQCETKGREMGSWEINLGKDFPFGDILKKPEPPAEGYEPVNISSVVAGFQNLEAAEAANLKTRFNIDISAANDLALEDVGLQPNPAVGLFRLQFRLPESGLTTVRIYNSAGRLIYEYELGVFSGEFSDEVDISQNGAGNYYLEVRQGERSASRKIVLQN